MQHGSWATGRWLVISTITSLGTVTRDNELFSMLRISGALLGVFLNMNQGGGCSGQQERFCFQNL